MADIDLSKADEKNARLTSRAWQAGFDAAIARQETQSSRDKVAALSPIADVAEGVGDTAREAVEYMTSLIDDGQYTESTLRMVPQRYLRQLLAALRLNETAGEGEAKVVCPDCGGNGYEGSKVPTNPALVGEYDAACTICCGTGKVAASTVPQEQGASELWALCYLHDWDEKREDGSQPIYPEVHRVYDTWQEAEAARASKIGPDKYWVRRAHRGVFRDGKDDFLALTQPSSRVLAIEEAAKLCDEAAAKERAGLNELTAQRDKLAASNAAHMAEMLAAAIRALEPEPKP